MVRQHLFRTIMIAKGTAAVGFLQQRRDARLNFEYSFGKWEFIAKEQAGGDQWTENYLEETSGVREF